MNRNGKTKILFVYIQQQSLNSPLETGSFVEQDYRMLSKHYEVIPYHYTEGTAKMKYVRWLLENRSKYDLCYVWFGDLHATISSLLMKLLNKKCIIIAGGYDTMYIPQIKYGFLFKPQNYLYAWLHYNLSDAVMTTSDYLKKNIVSNIKVGESSINTVPLGFDHNFWDMDDNMKSDIALTVGNISTYKRAKLKGITVVIETARLVPSIKFEIIGVQEPVLSKLNDNLPNNVTILPILGKDELREHYRRAKVYLQISMSEAFGSALCEAMLCGCIPVGAKIGGIPEVIGSTGYYVQYGDAHETAESIKKAMSSMNGNKARERIKNLYSYDRRKKRIIELIDSLV